MSEQILPQSLESEKALISSFLHDPAMVGALCAASKIGPESFAVPHLRLMYCLLIDGWQAGAEPMDFVMLSQKLRDRGELDSCGGAYEVGSIFTYLPTAANAERYIEIIKSKQALRRIIMACRDADERSYAQESPEGILASLSGVVSEIGQADTEQILPMCKNVSNAALSLQSEVDGNSVAIRTDLKALDVDAGPLERGNLLVIGGQRKAGKSMLATQIAMNVALNGKPVVFFSLEMNEQELTMRMLASLGRVEPRRIRLWNEGEYQRFFIAQGRLSKTDLHIVCRRYDLNEIAGICRQFHAKHARDNKLACIVLDYAQLVSAPPRGKDERRQQEVAAVSRMAKRLASELDVLFILLTQLNDDGRAREARDIEMDCNMMLEVGCDEKGNRGVRVVCARSAPSGEHLKLSIIPQHTRVQDAD